MILRKIVGVEHNEGGRVLGRPRIGLLTAVALGGIAAPGHAQSDADIAALIAESETPRDAIGTARQQTASGDLAGAASTLERALLADPNAHDARLLYAATLCRLGDTQGARIEIAKLDRQEIGEAGWSEANEACGGTLRRPLPAEAGNAGGGLSGEAYVGLAYDRDAAGAIVLQFDFFGAGERDDGWSVVSGARLNWRADNYATSGGIYAGASVGSKHEISGPDLDYDIGELRVGYGHGGGATAWSVGPVVRHVRLFGDPYVTEFGGQGDILFGNARANRIRLRAEAVHQDYDGDVPGNDGNGIRGEVSIAYETRLRDKGFATIGVAGEYKDAEERFFSYRGGHLFGGLFLPFESRHYLTLSGTLRYIDFRNDDSLDRKDTRAYVRGGYGIPLAGTPLYVEGALSYTYRKIDTDVVRFRRYKSPGAEVRLIWKF